MRETKGADKTYMHLAQAAPGNELRRWLHHDPKSWEEFERRYNEHAEILVTGALSPPAGVDG